LGKGVITDPLVWRSTLMRVIGSAHAHGAVLLGLKESPLRGSEGNLEFLLHLGKPGSDRMDSVEGKVTAETLLDALLLTEPEPRTETGQT